MIETPYLLFLGDAPDMLAAKVAIGIRDWRPDHAVGQIRLPEICSNVCFGGTKRNQLFMTASQSLYSVFVETTGAHIT